MISESFTENGLTLELAAAQDVVLTWRGKSTARDPAAFVLPVLMKALDQGVREAKRVIIDFRNLEYMNSSTITPLIRILSMAQRGDVRVTVMYDSKLRWQELSFTALEIFETDDKRVEICSV
ncbi:MAG: hypothetical protein AB1405_14005 [Bdellovibrionota bacterium]